MSGAVMSWGHLVLVKKHGSYARERNVREELCPGSYVRGSYVREQLCPGSYVRRRPVRGEVVGF